MPTENDKFNTLETLDKTMTLGDIFRGKYYTRMSHNTPIVLEDANRWGFGSLHIDRIEIINGLEVIVLST